MRKYERKQIFILGSSATGSARKCIRGPSARMQSRSALTVKAGHADC
jgi:hypothetical protein